MKSGYWFSFCLMDLMVNGFFHVPIWRFAKTAIPKKKVLRRKKVDKCQQKFVMCLFGGLQKRPYQKKQPFSSKLAPTKSSNHLKRCQFGGKMLRNTFFFFFFWYGRFCKPPNGHMKKSIKVPVHMLLLRN